MSELLHKKSTEDIIKIYFDIYNQLGYGFLEKIYQNAMFFELKNNGYNVKAQSPIKVYLKGQLL